MIVSISKQQQEFLLKKLLLGYYHRLKKGSFLQHIYGVFKLIIKGNIYRLLIMENPAYGLYNPSISVIRGIQNRRVNISSVSNMIADGFETTIPFQDSTKIRKLVFTPEIRRHILSVIYADMKFLREARAVDYNVEIYTAEGVTAISRNVFIETQSQPKSVAFVMSNFLHIQSSKKCFKGNKYEVSSIEYANSLTSNFSSIV